MADSWYFSKAPYPCAMPPRCSLPPACGLPPRWSPEIVPAGTAPSDPAEFVWYLPAGVTNDNCKAAYIPKGAASLLDSYINVAHPGATLCSPNTYSGDGNLQVSAPSWDVNGWEFVNPDKIHPVQLLNSGISTADIGHGTGTVVVFYTGPESNPNDDTSFFGINIWDDPDYFASNQIEIDLSNVNNGKSKFYNGTGWQGDSYPHATIDYASAGMAAVAGQHGYLNGTYANVPVEPVWQLPYDGPIYIGGYIEQDIVSGGTVIYQRSWWGFNGTIHAILFYDTELTQIQLDELRANAITVGITLP